MATEASTCNFLGGGWQGGIYVISGLLYNVVENCDSGINNYMYYFSKTFLRFPVSVRLSGFVESKFLLD